MKKVETREKLALAVTSIEGHVSMKRKVPKEVLDEESYTENVEKIIVRDFFPDHEHLKDQKEYLDAEERKDFEKMRQIALKYAAVQRGSTPASFIGNTPLPSPATFETPLAGDKRSSSSTKRNKEQVNAEPADSFTGDHESSSVSASNKPAEKKDNEVGLDKFLSKYTSEDNESFEGIMEKAEQARREKHSWLYEAEKNHAVVSEKILQLEGSSSETLAITDVPDKNGDSLGGEGKTKPIHMWKYTNKNALMYYPEGIDNPNDTAIFKKPRVIEHKNTRFANDPFKNSNCHAKIALAASESKLLSGEKVGHDGKSLIPQESPRVAGFGFVATPSPMPGVNESPLMTWGEIESTPARADGNFTPGPSFRFPEDSERDKLTYKMVDQHTKKKRAKKDAALKQMKASVLGTPKTGSIMSAERLNTLSPAARRLVNKKFNLGSDRALKASYTPTPSQRRTRGSETPIAKTPTPNSRKTPKNPTPGRSITDNLLNIPSKTRKAASDFF
uniref:Protein DGCR14 n=1 Tax=Phallusia mammillata TaxID=59560 RepID=A0A6F9DB09_9ASCI|nr:protein DGCR14 [Phallusia mammillata]